MPNSIRTQLHGEINTDEMLKEQMNIRHKLICKSQNFTSQTLSDNYKFESGLAPLCGQTWVRARVSNAVT